ncbi:MAG: hypothetical protein IAE86_01725 [Burkholderiaceae bacterium]|nr:hypothetical protein [Burkholderiaceae bacterium]
MPTRKTTRQATPPAAQARPTRAAAAAVPDMPDDGALLERIHGIWERSRTQAARSVNTAHVCANWLIGQQVVEAEQRGKRRAGYGQALLKTLSAQLAGEFGSGFSVSALQYMRGFYLAYPQLLAAENQHAVRVEPAAAQMQHAPRAESHDVEAAAGGDRTDSRPGLLHPALSWTHYRLLLKVERREARDFHELAACKAEFPAQRDFEREFPSLKADFATDAPMVITGDDDQRDAAGGSVLALLFEGVARGAADKPAATLLHLCC